MLGLTHPALPLLLSVFSHDSLNPWLLSPGLHGPHPGVTPRPRRPLHQQPQRRQRRRRRKPVPSDQLPGLLLLGQGRPLPQPRQTGGAMVPELEGRGRPGPGGEYRTAKYVLTGRDLPSPPPARERRASAPRQCLPVAGPAAPSGLPSPSPLQVMECG